MILYFNHNDLCFVISFFFCVCCLSGLYFRCHQVNLMQHIVIVKKIQVIASMQNNKNAPAATSGGTMALYDFIENCQFSCFFVENNGSAVLTLSNHGNSVREFNLTIVNCIFNNTSAKNDGSSIYAHSNALITIENTDFSEIKGFRNIKINHQDYMIQKLPLQNGKNVIYSIPLDGINLWDIYHLSTSSAAEARAAISERPMLIDMGSHDGDYDIAIRMGKYKYLSGMGNVDDVHDLRHDSEDEVAEYNFLAGQVEKEETHEEEDDSDDGNKDDEREYVTIHSSCANLAKGLRYIKPSDHKSVTPVI